ncbi:GNAT family N-acetyltransferase [Plantactinospora sp. S1510]|uniref:GNAT family N-acetyltransferase n=1 Tax=Plantactinospora alkalitolerans TaxID=2789879 RepID=A0ABS0H1S6_9ACTN|nr:GNAT family N-acetyltransferase [Plantactinospora alkalitolerans]
MIPADHPDMRALLARVPAEDADESGLTAPAERGRGLARAVATAAVTAALEADLLPQWRARPEASRRVARALGFSELGSQLSIRLEPADSRAVPVQGDSPYPGPRRRVGG